MAADPYATLGVGREATPDEIKSAYRKLARRYHPDVNPDNPEAEEKFKEIGQAYSILGDEEKKARFDQFGVTDDQPQGGGPGGEYFGAGTNINDLFEQFFGGFGGGGFGGGGGRGAGRDGDDVRADSTVTLHEVLTGTQRTIKYRRMAVCEHCQGEGAEPGTPVETCATCNGRGAVMRIANTILGQVQTQTTCPTCRGAGKTIQTPCKECSGRKVTVQDAEVDITIPPGVDDGITLRVAGRGNDGIDGGTPGDLYVVISVQDSPGTWRDNLDLHRVIEISYIQAVMGDTISVDALDGKIELKLDAGTQPEATARVRGRGLPRLRGTGRGDFVVHWRLVVPKKISAEQVEALKAYAQASGEKLPEADGGLLGGLFGKKKRKK